MEKIIPEKLKIGDEIRIVAPSRSLKVLKEDIIEISTEKLEKNGFKVSFSKNVMKYQSENFKCASIEDRVQDLHEAFLDKAVFCKQFIYENISFNSIISIMRIVV